METIEEEWVLVYMPNRRYTPKYATVPKRSLQVIQDLWTGTVEATGSQEEMKALATILNSNDTYLYY